MSTVRAQLVAAASRYGIDPALALAVAYQESRWNQEARGRDGEIGVMQLMPATARDLGVDPYDQAQNIDGGVRYLAQLLNSTGSVENALWAYNAGPGSQSRGVLPGSTAAYIPSVLTYLDQFAGDFAGQSWLRQETLPDTALSIDSPLMVATAVMAAAAIYLFIF